MVLCEWNTLICCVRVIWLAHIVVHVCGKSFLLVVFGKNILFCGNILLIWLSQEFVCKCDDVSCAICFIKAFMLVVLAISEHSMLFGVSVINMHFWSWYVGDNSCWLGSIINVIRCLRNKVLISWLVRPCRSVGKLLAIMIKLLSIDVLFNVAIWLRQLAQCRQKNMYLDACCGIISCKDCIEISPSICRRYPSHVFCIPYISTGIISWYLVYINACRDDGVVWSLTFMSSGDNVLVLFCEFLLFSISIR